MKKLLFALLLHSSANAQIQTDKVMHFGAGALISATTTAITYKLTDNKTASMLCGFGMATLAGIGKEVYDKKTGKGVADINDAIWTSIGGGIGVTIVFTLK